MNIIQRQAVLASTLNTSGVLDLLPVSALVLNEDRQIVLANGSMARLAKRPAAELLGLRVGEALGCGHRHATTAGCGTTPFCCHCGAARAIVSGLSGRHDVQECRIVRDGANGDDPMSAANYQFFSTPLALAGERFIFSTMLDVSFERRVEVYERLFRHDILSASSGIHGLCSLMAEQVGGDPRQEAEVLLGASERLVDMLLAQRQFTEAESREMQVRPVKLGSRALLLELADFFQRQPVAAGRRLVVAPESEDVLFCADRDLLYRVMANLTRNALEATAPGESVTLSCGVAPGGVFYRVHNPGVMPESVRLQLFTRFFSTKGPGRGLGTYCARLLAEEYLGGRLLVRSQAEVGTEFSMILPKERQDLGASPALALTPPANAG